MSDMVFMKLCEMSGVRAVDSSPSDMPASLPAEWRSELSTQLETAFAAQAVRLRREMREELGGMLGRREELGGMLGSRSCGSRMHKGRWTCPGGSAPGRGMLPACRHV